jgi:hypothetical protein
MTNPLAAVAVDLAGRIATTAGVEGMPQDLMLVIQCWSREVETLGAAIETTWQQQIIGLNQPLTTGEHETSVAVPSENERDWNALARKRAILEDEQYEQSKKDLEAKEFTLRHRAGGPIPPEYGPQETTEGGESEES